MKRFPLIFALALLAACSGGVDKTPPTVRLSGSVTEVRFSGPITLTAFATDDRGLEKVEFFEGSSKLGVDTSAPYTWKVDYKAAQSGKKSYSAVATDTSGNSKESDSLVVNVAITRGFALLGAGSLNINANRNAEDSSLALDGSGNPVVAWGENDGTSRNVYVKRWNGTAWVLVGSGFLDVNTNQNAGKPSLALDSSGNPLVAWGEYDGISNNIYVKRWDGSTWASVGDGFLDANTNQSAYYPSVKLDSSGNPMVAWSERDGTSENIYLKRRSGRNWGSVGIGSLDANVNQNATSPSLALDSSGLPVVAWSETDSIANNIYVKRFND